MSRPRASSSHNKIAALSTAYSLLGAELTRKQLSVVGDYSIGKPLGEGTFGTVHLGVHRLTGTSVAIKQISKQSCSSLQLIREIHHHRSLHHEHIVRLIEIVASENDVWLVQELCHGGELYDYLVARGSLSELESARIFGQLLFALGFAHRRGIVHRDLKLENILLDAQYNVKLSDFGFTRSCDGRSLLDTWCGTTGYASPEMLRGEKYDGRATDVWSSGIILFALLTGTLPWEDDDDAVMREMILQGDLPSTMQTLTPSAQDLIRNLLQPSASKRLTVEGALAHSWFSERHAPYTAASSIRSPSPRASPRNSIDVRSPPNLLLSPPVLTSRGMASDFAPATTPDNAKFPLPHFSRTGSGSRSTPSRTKRRSVSSQLSLNALSPIVPNSTSELSKAPIDYRALLDASPYEPFELEWEKGLVRELEVAGVNTRQLMHSVRSYACDAPAALWFFLRCKRAPTAQTSSESKALGLNIKEGADMLPMENPPQKISMPQNNPFAPEPSYFNSEPEKASVVQQPASTTMSTDPSQKAVKASHTQSSTSAPTSEPKMKTPPTPPTAAFATPVASPAATSVLTPSSGLKLRLRSPSVSILQRATSALGATLLTRKKSSELLDGSDQVANETTTKAHIVNSSANGSTHSPGGSFQTIPENDAELDSVSALPGRTGQSSKKHRHRRSLFNTVSGWFNDTRKRKPLVSQTLAGAAPIGPRPHGHPLETPTPHRRPIARRQLTDDRRSYTSSRRSSTTSLGSVAQRSQRGRRTLIESPSASSLDSAHRRSIHDRTMSPQIRNSYRRSSASSYHSGTRVMRHTISGAPSPVSVHTREFSDHILLQEKSFGLNPDSISHRSNPALSTHSDRSHSPSHHSVSSSNGRRTVLVAHKKISPFAPPRGVATKLLEKNTPVAGSARKDVFGTANRRTEEDWEDEDADASTRLIGGIGQVSHPTMPPHARPKGNVQPGSPAYHAFARPDVPNFGSKRMSSPMQRNSGVFPASSTRLFAKDASRDKSLTSDPDGQKTTVIAQNSVARRNLPVPRNGPLYKKKASDIVEEDEEEPSFRSLEEKEFETETLDTH